MIDTTPMTRTTPNAANSILGRKKDEKVGGTLRAGFEAELLLSTTSRESEFAIRLPGQAAGTSPPVPRRFLHAVIITLFDAPDRA
jgi:hypothetical protein